MKIKVAHVNKDFIQGSISGASKFITSELNMDDNTSLDLLIQKTLRDGYIKLDTGMYIFANYIHSFTVVDANAEKTNIFRKDKFTV